MSVLRRRSPKGTPAVIPSDIFEKEKVPDEPGKPTLDIQEFDTVTIVTVEDALIVPDRQVHR